MTSWSKNWDFGFRVHHGTLGGYGNSASNHWSGGFFSLTREGLQWVFHFRPNPRALSLQASESQAPLWGSSLPDALPSLPPTKWGCPEPPSSCFWSQLCGPWRGPGWPLAQLSRRLLSTCESWDRDGMYFRLCPPPPGSPRPTPFEIMPGLAKPSPRPLC